MMDDEPERMDPRCDAGGRGYMLWMECCNDGEYVRATDYDALAAKLAAAEAHIAHLESHIEAVAKDTHKIMVDLATPVTPWSIRLSISALNDPRVKALQDKAQAVVDRWDSPLWKDLRHTGTHINELRDAISALKENK